MTLQHRQEQVLLHIRTRITTSCRSHAFHHRHRNNSFIEFKTEPVLDPTTRAYLVFVTLPIIGAIKCLTTVSEIKGRAIKF